MKTIELKQLLKEIEKIDGVNYAEINHANEQLKISVKPYTMTALNFGIKELKKSFPIASDLVYDKAYKTNVSRIVLFNYN